MVEVKLKKGITLQPFKDLIQGKQRKEAFKVLRDVLFTDRFDHPPWYRNPGVLVKFEDLVDRKPEDVYYGQHNILYFVYQNEFKDILKKLFESE